jgi:hypothetical protein
MAASSSNHTWVKQARKSWLVLAQGSLWVGGILGGFLLPPPAGLLASEEKVWLRLGQFVIAVVLGLVFFAGRRWGQPRYAPWWAGAALLVLAVAVAVFFRYQQLTLAWTGDYAGQRVVVGAVLTPHGQAYTQANPDLSRDQLIMDVAGATEAIWTGESINRRRLILAATYVCCLPLFTLCLIAVVQAIQCGGQMTRTKRAR